MDGEHVMRLFLQSDFTSPPSLHCVVCVCRNNKWWKTAKWLHSHAAMNWLANHMRHIFHFENWTRCGTLHSFKAFRDEWAEKKFPLLASNLLCVHTMIILSLIIVNLIEWIVRGHWHSPSSRIYHHITPILFSSHLTLFFVVAHCTPSSRSLCVCECAVQTEINSGQKILFCCCCCRYF